KAAVQDGKWYGGEPLWVVAAKSGMVSASYFWVGSEAEIDGFRPSFSYAYDTAVTREARVEETLKWLAMPEAERPHLITLYFSEVDSASHQFGLASKEFKAALAQIDATIGSLREGLKKTGLPVNLIVVSDHGMQELNSKKVEYPEDEA